MDGYFDGQEIPSQYTAHNITVTLRTVIRGLAYLLTFLFGANALGLAGTRNWPNASVWHILPDEGRAGDLISFQ